MGRTPTTVPHRITRDLRRASGGTAAVKEFCAREIMPRTSKAYFKDSADEISVAVAYQVGYHSRKAWIPSPQPRKDNTDSQQKSRPLQPREAPIKRRLQREHREKKIEERTQHSRKHCAKSKRKCAERRRDSSRN